MIIYNKQKERWLAKSNEELSLNIQEERIDNVLTAKYLGIQVDSNLNWKGHIKALSSKNQESNWLLNTCQKLFLS